MKNEKIEVIYQMIIKNITLSKRNLNVNGVSNEDISMLEDMKLIKSCGIDMYQLVSVRDLYNYGIKLINLRRGFEAELCFSKCYEMAPNDRDINLQYLLSFIRKDKYKEAFEVYKKLAHGETYDSYKDDNLYLLMFSVLTNLDKEYASIVKNMSLKDIMLEDTVDNKLDNEIRKNIMQAKYPYACSLMNDKRKNIDGYLVKMELLKYFIIRVLETERKFKTDLFCFVKEEKYNDVVKMLRNRENQRNLNRVEKSILYLSETIVSALENNELDICEAKDLKGIYTAYEAIDVCDYKLALEMNMEFLERKKENKDNDMVHILLTKIMELSKIVNASKKDDISGIVISKDDVIYDGNDTSNLCGEHSDDIYYLIKDMEEWAEYIKSLGMGIRKGIRKVGLVPKYAYMVRLMFAKEYYISGDYVSGDLLLDEVNNADINDADLMYIMKYVIDIRENYIDKGYKKKLVNK